jgi:xanthine dehydrogenase YagS FAD-binding subunit
VLLRLHEDGTVAAARIVLGGLAHKPWSIAGCEAALIGRLPENVAFAQVAQAALAEAETDNQTEFRRALVHGVLAEALERAAQRASAKGKSRT